MITNEEAFDRGFAVMVDSINSEELKFAYRENVYALKRTPSLMGQLINKDGMTFLPVFEDVGWDGSKK